MLVRLRSSLRVRLLLLAAIAMVPAFSLFLYSAARERTALLGEYEDTAQRLARLASSEAERQIASTRELLGVLAQLPAVRQARASCSGLLGEIIGGYPMYQNLAVATEDGELVCSARPASTTINVADRPYFERAMRSGHFAIGDFLIGRVSGRAALVVATPILHEQQAKGVVLASLDLAWFHRVLDHASLPAGSRFTIVDSAGTILVRHPGGPEWVGTRAEFTPQPGMLGRAEAAVAGDTHLVGFAPMLGGGNAGDIYVSVDVPKAAALAPIDAVYRRQLAGLVVTCALSLGVAWVGGSAFVLGRVRELVGVTRRLAGGELTVRASGPFVGELGALARAFNEMADAIRARQEMLVRSERLAALGRLSAAVGHELRNPLTVVSGRTQMLERHRAAGESLEGAALARFIESLKEAAARMQHIVNGLSTYSKPGSAEPTRLDMGALLEATRELVSVSSKRVTTEVTADGGPFFIRAVRSGMMQILVNLATNAVEAMAETGGRLTMSAAREDGDVVVCISDTGPGIPADRRARIWESFYTTKPEGTGLGLAIVKSLVEAQPGATIDVESTVGVGTVFRLRLAAA